MPVSWLGLVEKQERIERATVDTLRDEIRTGLDSGASKRTEDVFARLEAKYDQPVFEAPRLKALRPLRAIERWN